MDMYLWALGIGILVFALSLIVGRRKSWLNHYRRGKAYDGDRPTDTGIGRSANQGDPDSG
ncbi:hypothetical protein ACA086_08380 [Muriicola sp. E247]|uniref:hypothetical protein n=1 Tax=unclassified Muriicola TaxID=2647561 RepID=UPI0017E0A57D|nr:hypothetical protein [Maribacter sp.]